jgi:hypothetical protein
MSKEKRSDLVFGIILLLIGGWFLAATFNLVPDLNEIINVQYQWPLIVIGVGVFLFLLGLLTRNPGMSVPACIVSGIGAILYWTKYDWKLACLVIFMGADPRICWGGDHSFYTTWR